VTLAWAILGTGRFASARVAPALNRAHGCKAVAVVSRDRSRAEAFATEFGIPAAYASLDEALTDPRVQAVWVATPHSLHHDSVLAAARAGRHVLCEKPLAGDPSVAREMVRACDQAGVVLGTGFHLRHHPLHVEMRRLLQSGKPGAVLSADAEWSLSRRAETEAADWRWDLSIAGGGIFTATGVHALDLLRFVLADEVVSVAATMEPLPASGNVERRLVATLSFKRGAIATLQCHRSVFATTNDLLIDCEHAGLRARHTLDEQARGVLETEGVSAHLAGVPVGTDLYALQAEAFVEAVARGRQPSASGEDGLVATELTAAIYAAAVSGRTVTVAPS
jgi:1,5-anhydro-D-fructose reductase (1,5-anhydro-D-mannitol-forming)